jgi:hypothetical protein
MLNGFVVFTRFLRFLNKPILDKIEYCKNSRPKMTTIVQGGAGLGTGTMRVTAKTSVPTSKDV